MERLPPLVVANSLVAVATQREWMVLRAAVLCNHVHVVVTGWESEPGDLFADQSGGVKPRRSDGEAVRRILKGNTQAALSEAVGASRRWWTAGGSDQKRCGERSVEATIQYVADQPGKLAEVVENVAFLAGDDNERRD